MLNFALLECNKKSLNELSHILDSIFVKYDFDAEICFSTTYPNDLLNYITRYKIDALILDIGMEVGQTGLEIAEKVRSINKDCYLIFQTSHIECTPLAYKYKTFDFICKPITYEKLEQCIIRLFDDVKDINKKFIDLGNKNSIISEDDVKYIKKDGAQLIFHTSLDDYKIYSSFSKLQNHLPNNFVRCHKSFIANVNNITKIDTSKNIVYFNTSCCDIGPKYKNGFLEVLENNGSSRRNGF